MVRYLFALATALLLFAPTSSSNALERTVSSSVAGRASVVDGDTLDIHNSRIRLWGMDAPERSQTCKDAAGADYRCGTLAARALDEHLNGLTVSCTGRDVDRYKRIVALCHVGRTDVGGWMVENGQAVAYRSNAYYKDREREARLAKRGIWQGSFILPWNWRRGVR